jgi:hypothetical protein
MRPALYQCPCRHDWCNAIAGTHIFSNSFTKFPDDYFERSMWHDLLQIPMDEREDIAKRSRVGIWHFFAEDYIITRDIEGNAEFQGLLRGDTRHRENTGHDNTHAPPRPAATRENVHLSIFCGRNLLKYDEYLVYAQSQTKPSDRGGNHTKKRAGAALQSLLNAKVIRLGRPPEVPHHENYLGCFAQLSQLIAQVDEHAKDCGGALAVYRRRNGMTLVVSIRCCRCWPGSRYTWKSCGTISSPDGTRVDVPVFHVLFAIATYMTPTTPSHAEQFMRALLIPPPSRKTNTKNVHAFVEPYLSCSDRGKGRSQKTAKNSMERASWLLSMWGSRVHATHKQQPGRWGLDSDWFSHRPMLIVGPTRRKLTLLAHHSVCVDPSVYHQ